MWKLTQHEEKIAQNYNELTKGYEMWSGRHHGGYHFGIPNTFFDRFRNSKMIQNLSNLIIDQLNITDQTQHILDAGCGVGDIARMIKERYPRKNLVVHGVTLSEKQIEIGKSRLLRQGVEGVRLGHEGFDRLSFPENFFDFVFYVDSLCYGQGKSKNKTLQECYRVLKPGGTILVSDGFMLTNPEQWEKGWQHWDAKIKKAWGIEEWIVEKDFFEAAESIGLKKIREIDLTQKISPSINFLIYSGILSYIFRPVIRALRIMSTKELDTLKEVTLGFIMNRHSKHSSYKIIVLQK